MHSRSSLITVLCSLLLGVFSTPDAWSLRVNGTLMLPVAIQGNKGQGNNDTQPVSGGDFPWEVPFNRTRKPPVFFIDLELLAFYNLLQWLLPLNKPESSETSIPTSDGEAPDRQGEASTGSSQPDPASNEADATGTGNQRPDNGMATPFEMTSEVLYIEAILLERYARAMGISLPVVPVLPAVNESPEGMGLSQLTAGELEKKLIEYSRRGNLHAMLVRVVHYLGGLLNYDPARAGELLRRIRAMPNPVEVGSVLQTFCSDRQPAIYATRAYQLLMAALITFKLAEDPFDCELGPASQLSPSRGGSHPVFVQEILHHGKRFLVARIAGTDFIYLGLPHKSALLTLAAMTLEAGVEDEMLEQHLQLFQLLSVIDSGSVTTSEQQAIALVQIPQGLTARQIYRGWLIYYLGRYSEEKGSIMLSRNLMTRYQAALQSVEITWEPVNGGYVQTSLPAQFYIQAAGNGCTAATIATVSRMKHMVEDSSSAAIQSRFLSKISFFTGLLVNAFTRFEALLEHLLQMPSDTALNVAWAFQQAQDYEKAAAIYRRLTGLSLPEACHRLGWLIHQGKVQGTPEEAAKLYLQALEAGYQPSLRRLRQLYQSHREAVARQLDRMDDKTEMNTLLEQLKISD